MKRKKPQIIEAFSGIRKIYESSEKDNNSQLSSSNSKLAVAMNAMRSLYDKSSFLKNEKGSEWLLNNYCYNSLYEIYFQYFLTIIAIELKKKGALSVPISNIALRIVKTPRLVSEYITIKDCSFHYIVLSMGYYELLYARGLFHKHVSAVGELADVDNYSLTNHIGGYSFVSAFSKHPELSIMQLDDFISELTKKLGIEANQRIQSEEECIARDIKMESIFFDIVQEFIKKGSPDIFTPIERMTKYFPLFFMLFSMFHELSHLSHGLIGKMNLRNLKEEFSCDLLSIYNLYVLEHYISQLNSCKTQHSIFIPLATALFCDINHMVAAIKEYPLVLNNPIEDLQKFYDKNLWELEEIPRMVEEIGLREFPLIESRIMDVSPVLGVFSDNKEEEIDLFFDCYSELKIGSIFTVDRMTLPLISDYKKMSEDCKSHLEIMKKQARQMYKLLPPSLDGYTFRKSKKPNELVMRLVLLGFECGIKCLNESGWLSPILLSMVHGELCYIYFYRRGERLTNSLKRAEITVKTLKKNASIYALVYLGWVQYDGIKKDVIFAKVGERMADSGFKFALPYKKDALSRKITFEREIYNMGISDLLW